MGISRDVWKDSVNQPTSISRDKRDACFQDKHIRTLPIVRVKEQWYFLQATEKIGKMEAIETRIGITKPSETHVLNVHVTN